MGPHSVTCHPAEVTYTRLYSLALSEEHMKHGADRWWLRLHAEGRLAAVDMRLDTVDTVSTRGQSRTVLADDGTGVHSTHAPAFQSPPSGSGTLRVSLSFPRLRRFVFFVPSDTGCWQISGEVRDMVARQGPCSLSDDGTDVHSTR